MAATAQLLKRQFEDIVEGVKLEAKRPPPLLEWAWALSLLTALVIPLYNLFWFSYPEDRAAINWIAWVFYSTSVVIAVKIYQIPGPPNPRDPKKPLRRTLSILISGLVGMAVLLYNIGYYFVSDDFNRHRFQVEQQECMNRIQAFLSEQGESSGPSHNVCVPELITPPPGMEGDQRAWCTRSFTETRYGFWRWFWWATGNYFGAVGTTTVV